MSDWDILNLDEYEFTHLQILDRLHEEGIVCYFADIWLDNIVVLMGCHPQSIEGAYEVATALNVPEQCVYVDYDTCVYIINLYQLKAIRSGVSDIIEREFP